MRNAVRNSIRLACALCACFLATASSAAPTVRNRADIAPEFKWDFTAIYPSVQAWEDGMREMDAKMQAFAARQGTLAQGPAAVLTAYQAFDEIGKLQYRLYRYAQLQRDIDTRDQVVAARFQRVNTVFAKFRTASAWFTPELLKIPEATMTSWIDRDARSRPLSLSHPRQLPPPGARARRQGRAPVVARQPPQRGAEPRSTPT